MEILTGIIILLYACYTAFVIHLFGIPISYSITYYLLGGKKGDGWIFQVVMGTVAFLALISGLDTGGEWNFLAFIPAAALLFVSADPDFDYNEETEKKPLENKVHMIASYIAVIGATLSFWLKFDMPLIAIGFSLFAVVIWFINPKVKIFLIEHVCFDIYLILLLISHL